MHVRVTALNSKSKKCVGIAGIPNTWPGLQLAATFGLFSAKTQYLILLLEPHTT